MNIVSKMVILIVAILSTSVFFWLMSIYHQHGMAMKSEGTVSVLSALSQTDITSLMPPQVVSVSPADGSIDVVLDIEDPIAVNFDHSTEKYFIDFRFAPDVGEVLYENNDSKTEFRIIPKDALKDGTEYALSIWARPKNDQSIQPAKLFETRFTTLPPVPDSWSSDFAVRVTEAKRLTRPKIVQGKYIDINLSSQVMTIFESGKALDSYLVSSGKPGMETPKGSYQIRNKAPRPWSAAYGLYMPYWMALVPDGKFGIHELPEWPGGYKEGAAHLGRPVSHGCVRLGVGAAQRVYEWADIGTPVVVY